MTVEVAIVPEVAGLDPSHSAFELAHDELVRDLEASAITLSTVPAGSAPGHKGWQEILTAIVTDGVVVPVLVEVIKSWVVRDEGRTVVVVVKSGDSDSREVTVRDEASAEDLRKALEQETDEK